MWSFRPKKKVGRYNSFVKKCFFIWLVKHVLIWTLGWKKAAYRCGGLQREHSKSNLDMVKNKTTESRSRCRSTSDFNSNLGGELECVHVTDFFCLSELIMILCFKILADPYVYEWINLRQANSRQTTLADTLTQTSPFFI